MKPIRSLIGILELVKFFVNASQLLLSLIQELVQKRIFIFSTLLFIFYLLSLIFLLRGLCILVLHRCLQELPYPIFTTTTLFSPISLHIIMILEFLLLEIIILLLYLNHFMKERRTKQEKH